MFWQSLHSSRVIRSVVAKHVDTYVRLVWKTSKIASSPETIISAIEKHQPCIVLIWHGQHLMSPYALPSNSKIKILIAPGSPGEIYARCYSNFGFEVLRGAGSRSPGRYNGGNVAFWRMLQYVKSGYSIVTAPDIPPDRHQIQRGIILLAQLTSRPILPIAITSSYCIVLNTWDRMKVELPFGKLAYFAGEPILIPRDMERVSFGENLEILKSALDHAEIMAHRLLHSYPALR